MCSARKFGTDFLGRASELGRSLASRTQSSVGKLLSILLLSRTILSMSIDTKSHLLARVAEHQQQLRRFGVKRLGVFGSFVRNEQDETSDVDVLVEFEPGRKTFDNFMHLAFYLEDLLGRNVDLLTPESLNPHLGPQILREVEYVALQS